jgi:hypothetical protein
MRNGTNAVFSEGEADELALYTRALSAAEVRNHFNLALDVADDPLPPAPSTFAAEPPAAGMGRAGGVLSPGGTTGTSGPGRAGIVRVRGARLIARAAAGRRNDLVVSRRGRFWMVRDRLAALRAGRGCKRLGARVVRCRARGVRRLLVYGGAGNDRLTVIGRAPVSFRGGPGHDRKRVRTGV